MTFFTLWMHQFKFITNFRKDDKQLMSKNWGSRLISEIICAIQLQKSCFKFSNFSGSCFPIVIMNFCFSGKSVTPHVQVLHMHVTFFYEYFPAANDISMPRMSDTDTKRSSKPALWTWVLLSDFLLLSLQFTIDDENFEKIYIFHIRFAKRVWPELQIWIEDALNVTKVLPSHQMFVSSATKFSLCFVIADRRISWKIQPNGCLCCLDHYRFGKELLKWQIWKQKKIMVCKPKNKNMSWEETWFSVSNKDNAVGKHIWSLFAFMIILISGCIRFVTNMRHNVQTLSHKWRQRWQVLSKVIAYKTQKHGSKNFW